MRSGDLGVLNGKGAKIDSPMGCPCSESIVRCGGATSIDIAWEDIDGAISERPGSGELAYDEGEPADSLVGETVWR